MLVIPSVVLVPVIIVRAAGLDAGYLSWTIFAALLVCGLITLLQSFRTGFIGAGHILISTSAATSIAVCILALSAGGVALMMNLVIVSALFQLVLSSHLSLLRRIITPVVSGMVLMLIAVAVMPVAFDMLTHAPEGAVPVAAPSIAAVTLLVLVALVFGTWRRPAALGARYRDCCRLRGSRIFWSVPSRSDMGGALVQYSLKQPAAVQPVSGR